MTGEGAVDYSASSHPPDRTGRRLGRLGACRPHLTCQRSNRSEQRKRIVVQRQAFELELVERPIAELRKILTDESRQVRVTFELSSNRGRITGRQVFDQPAVGRRQPRHVLQQPDRLRADHAAVTGNQVVAQRDRILAAPPLEEATEHPVRDHREEVVGERRVPREQQSAAKLAIVGHQFVGRSSPSGGDGGRSASSSRR